jgi:hypothetical protein
MLVSKKPNLNGKIVAAKLISGEEIMAKLISVDDGCVKLNRPVSYVMGVNPDNSEQAEVMFSPWMLGIEFDTTVELDVKHILFMGESSEDATTKYKAVMYDNQPAAKETVITTTGNSKSGIGNPATVMHRR